MIRHLQGDCRQVLRSLPDRSVHCCITSPPYWGLRDYATARWEDGDAGCDHAASSDRPGRDRCGRCGAVRLDEQIGLEPTPERYVASLVEVFREVRRVLRDDGTLWLNLGDSYAGSWGNQGRKATRGTQRPAHGPMIQRFEGYGDLHEATHTGSWVGDHPVLKPKDLVGIPWRVAFALQEDGWYLRSDVVWHNHQAS
jgi:DNA modification methylase